jgi:phage tail-like protein
MTAFAPVATSYRFQVVFAVAAARGAQGPTAPPGPSALGTGGFSECTGLEVEMDVSEYQEGGHNDRVVQRAGRAKYPKLVLKRGMLLGSAGRVVPELWTWLQDAVAGTRPIRRYDGFVQVLDLDQIPVATWRFRRALPAKLAGPQLNARTGEVAIEELHLAHEGLWLVAS